MAIPDYQSSTELAAVNQILGAIGQAPVTGLDDPNPDVQIAHTTLLSINQEVQSEGWVFNTEREYPLVPNNDDEVLIPENALAVDLSHHPANYGLEVVSRDGKLYNKTDHTYSWEGYDEVLCDVLWLFSFSDCPQPFKDYITARAAVVASTRLVGDADQFRLLKDREMTTRGAVMEYECNQGNYSMFGPKDNRVGYNTYQPYKALMR